MAGSAGAFRLPALPTRVARHRDNVVGVTANLLENLFGMTAKTYDAPCVMGDESIMSQKAHGTSAVPVQKNLRWNCDVKTADNVSCLACHQVAIK